MLVLIDPQQSFKLTREQVVAIASKGGRKALEAVMAGGSKGSKLPPGV